VPSRARDTGCGAAGVGLHLLVEGVADLAFERPQCLLGCLALGDLLVVAGASLAVLVADLGDGGHVDGVVHPPVAAQASMDGMDRRDRNFDD
jgi:hypothetical protein